MDERRANWGHLKKLFDHNKIPFEEETIQRVMHQAPNSAFELLIGVYKFLTKRE